MQRGIHYKHMRELLSSISPKNLTKFHPTIDNIAALNWFQYNCCPLQRSKSLSANLALPTPFCGRIPGDSSFVPPLVMDENPLCTSDTGSYGLVALPVTQQTMSKHWRTLKALTPTRKCHPLAPSSLHSQRPSDGRGNASCLMSVLQNTK